MQKLSWNCWSIMQEFSFLARFSHSWVCGLVRVCTLLGAQHSGGTHWKRTDTGSQILSHLSLWYLLQHSQLDCAGGVFWEAESEMCAALLACCSFSRRVGLFTFHIPHHWLAMGAFSITYSGKIVLICLFSVFPFYNRKGINQRNLIYWSVTTVFSKGQKSFCSFSMMITKTINVFLCQQWEYWAHRCLSSCLVTI